MLRASAFALLFGGLAALVAIGLWFAPQPTPMRLAVHAASLVGLGFVAGRARGTHPAAFSAWPTGAVLAAGIFTALSALDLLVVLSLALATALVATAAFLAGRLGRAGDLSP